MIQNPPDNFIPIADGEGIPNEYIPVVIGDDPVGRVLGIEQALVAGYVPEVRKK